MRARRSVALYGSVGEILTHYAIDVETAELVSGATLNLGEPIEYAWPHPTEPLLYVICGHRGAAKRHLSQQLAVCRFDPATGSLEAHGAPLPLPARPIYLSVDAEGKYLFVAYNDPSGLTVHAILPDGMPTSPLPMSGLLDTGIYAHHVRVMPDNHTVVLVTRGNSATETQTEQPGALKLFNLHDGALADLTSIAPNSGYGFGPRDIDFHPFHPWAYVSLERQNRLQLFRAVGDRLEPKPAFDVSTLANPAHVEPRQLAGTVHIHPTGGFAYVANRADGLVDWQGHKVFRGGENSIAVFAIDPGTGEPRLIQSEDTKSIYVRTFSIDPSGRLLVAASTREIAIRNGADVAIYPAAITLFRIADDGLLEYVRKYDVETRNEIGEQQWVGFVDLARYARGQTAISSAQ